MCAYAFFVQMCREEHKKKNPEVPVNSAEFSKKCSERWKTMSRKEKSKFDEMAKAYKMHCDQEMKDYGPARGGKKKDPKGPKRLPSGFLLFCSEFHPKIKSTHPGISIRQVSVQFSHSVVYDSLRPHGLQHARLPCTSPTPWVSSNLCPLSRWCHPTISSYVACRPGEKH